jgi:hypothetical protein
MRCGNRFLILSLPRTGSTNLVDVLNQHRDIRCLSEPFGPQNYDGRFYRLADTPEGLDAALELIRDRWNGIKFVRDSSGYPFRGRPHLNDRVIAAPSVRILLLRRRNLLRRFVSLHLSRQTGKWNGPRAEFASMLEKRTLLPLEPDAVLRQLETDRDEMTSLQQSLAQREADVMTLHYEDLYRDDATSRERVAMVNRILAFLRFAPITEEAFHRGWRQLLETHNRWASPEVYRRIPGIEEVESRCGSDETGWLFH